jgi:outer membrane protein OmpA-like peptidoglycan-associated protein
MKTICGSGIPLMTATCAAFILLALAPNSQAGAQSLADRLKAVQSGKEGSSAKAVLPAWKPVSSATSKQEIPLAQGLTVVTAVSDPAGDYESIKAIASISAAKVVLNYSADKPVPKGSKPDTVRGTRNIDGPDLAGATSYSEYFGQGQEHFPGSTAISASTAVLNDLRAGKPVDFHFGAPVLGFMGIVIPMPGGDKSVTTNKNGQAMYTCSLKRVESNDLSAPVMVNDVRVELPAVHAKCSLADDEEAHFYFLDQPSNPITLAFELGPEDTSLQAIKITFPPPMEAKNPGAGSGAGGGGGGGGGGNMEQKLAEKKPVEVYGIYFDFNSANIKPESETVLKQIADIMRKNPDWKLSVGGHTDNIGGDAFNLDLSNRRAAAVKEALVSRYAIAAGRLATSGYGASRPIETNATLEGRARNRRVELQRE